MYVVVYVYMYYDQFKYEYGFDIQALSDIYVGTVTHSSQTIMSHGVVYYVSI